VAYPLQPHRLCAPVSRLTRTGEGTVAKEDRGFASMDRNRQRDIASKGGKAAHQKGTAHEWTSQEARDAGRKGGVASHRRKMEQHQPDARAQGADAHTQGVDQGSEQSVSTGDSDYAGWR
jgi:general stress protein YciG